MSNRHRESCRIFSALQNYERFTCGSPFPIYLQPDQKLILYLWGHKGQLCQRFFRYQDTITKFQILKIFWLIDSNSAFPDIFSRIVTLKEYQSHKLQPEKKPWEIGFFADYGNPVIYKIQHGDKSHDSCNGFNPTYCQQGKHKNISKLRNDDASCTLNSFNSGNPYNLPLTVSHGKDH